MQMKMILGTYSNILYPVRFPILTGLIAFFTSIPDRMKNLSGRILTYTKLISILFFILLINISTQSQTTKTPFTLQEGDLLFQNLDCGDFCNAVEKVTIGYKGARFSHVAIVAKDSTGNLVVIEAVSRGVSIISVKDFFNKSHDKNNNPKVIVGRLLPQYQHLIPKAIKEAYKLLGHKYDDVFCSTNDSYYCSELIYEIFKRANNSKEVFELVPMTFKDPDTKETFPIWTKYFQDLNKPIPEGEPGNNPGGISLSKKIKIVYAYGIPNGWPTNLIKY